MERRVHVIGVGRTHFTALHPRAHLVPVGEHPAHRETLGRIALKALQHAARTGRNREERGRHVRKSHEH